MNLKFGDTVTQDVPREAGKGGMDRDKMPSPAKRGEGQIIQLKNYLNRGEVSYPHPNNVGGLAQKAILQFYSRKRRCFDRFQSPIFIFFE